MPEYIIYGGKKITLEEYLQILGPKPGAPSVRLADKKPGDVVKLGKFEMIILDQCVDATFLLMKDAYCKCVEFGENNNFSSSFADEKCKDFAEDLKEIVGAKNVIKHVVHLTDTSGHTKYGYVTREASLLTLNVYKKYSSIINRFKLSDEWWLVTPCKDSDRGVCCIREDGLFYTKCTFDYDVRPFCMLNPNTVLSE